MNYTITKGGAVIDEDRGRHVGRVVSRAGRLFRGIRRGRVVLVRATKKEAAEELIQRDREGS